MSSTGEAWGADAEWAHRGSGETAEGQQRGSGGERKGSGGERKGSGGAAAHLPTCAGRRIVKLAEPDLVREGTRVLGGVGGLRVCESVRFWKGEAE